MSFFGIYANVHLGVNVHKPGNHTWWSHEERGLGGNKAMTSRLAIYVYVHEKNKILLDLGDDWIPREWSIIMEFLYMA